MTKNERLDQARILIDLVYKNVTDEREKSLLTLGVMRAFCTLVSWEELKGKGIVDADKMEERIMKNTELLW